MSPTRTTPLRERMRQDLQLAGLSARTEEAYLRAVRQLNESHGYRARESVLTVLAEMLEWFDTYVKRAEPRSITDGEAEM